MWELVDSVLKHYQAYILPTASTVPASPGGMTILAMAAQRDNFFA